MFRKAVVVVAFLAALFVSVPLMGMLRDSAGREVAAIATIACAVTAAWLGRHTSRSQEMAEDFRAALRDIGMSHKEAAIAMGVPEPVLACWLSGKEQASLWRIAELGPAFDVAFAKRRIARSGRAQVIDSQSICDLVNAVQVLTAERRRPVLVSRSEVA